MPDAKLRVYAKNNHNGIEPAVKRSLSVFFRINNLTKVVSEATTEIKQFQCIHLTSFPCLSYLSLVQDMILSKGVD